MSKEPPIPAAGTLNNLQVLRALAALAVVLFHTITLDKPLLRPWLFWGEAGVDLFFVISGFVMVYTTAGKSLTPGKFALNRIVRIVPMYWGLTLAVFAVALVAPSLLQASKANWDELLKSLLFIPFEKSNGAIQPVLFVGWTLNYEMFFYALFALSLTIGSVALRTAIMVVALSVFVTLGQLYAPTSAVARFYTDPILLDFLFGMVLGYFHWRTRARPIGAGWGYAALVIAALIAVANYYVLPGWDRAVSWGVPSAFVVLGTLLLDRRGRSYRGRFLLLIGAASYVLYLTHPFVVIPIEKLAMRFGLGDMPELLAIIVIDLVAASLVAIAVHLVIERPVTALLRGWLSGDRSPREWRDVIALWPWRLKIVASGDDKSE